MISNSELAEVATAIAVDTNVTCAVVTATLQQNQILISMPERRQQTKIPREIARSIMESKLKIAEESEYAEDFRKAYRLTQNEFSWLISQFPKVKRLNWDIRYQTMIFLDWLASKIHLEQLSRTYQMPKSTVHDSIKRILDFIMDLRDEIIFLPTEPAEIAEICAGFKERSNDLRFFDNVAGAIDGSLVVLVVPVEHKEAYFDRHLSTSMNVTAMCDHNMIIRFLIVGKTGACHDSNVLKSSALYQKKLYPPKGCIILGDSAYANTLDPIPIITPYKVCNNQSLLDKYKSNFNKTHSAARSTIERAYGDVKTKWRRIHKNIIESKLSLAPKLITAAFVLNNITLGNFHVKNRRFIEAPPIHPIIPFNNANEYRESVAQKFREM